MHRAPPAPPRIAAGIELSKPRRKLLASLGHRVMRLAEAGRRLHGRRENPPGLRPWLEEVPDPRTGPPGERGVFGCPLSIDGARLTLHPLVSSAAACEAAFRTLPDPLPDWPGVLTLPVPLNDAVWPALLRLRPLRDFWERELRRSGLEQLLEVLPDAWLLDPAPLPPGSVIPRLELASWNEFDPANFPGLEFTPATSAELAAALAAHPARPGVLTAAPRSDATSAKLVALYEKRGDEVTWIGVVPPAA